MKVSNEGVVISAEDEKGMRTVARNFTLELGNTNVGERRESTWMGRKWR